jgi:predicted AAA+ superfamily ATPase
MQTYIHRSIEKNVFQFQEIFPVIAILGPRQSGKSSLARYIQTLFPDSIFLDLEDDRHRTMLSVDPALFFETNQDKLIIIDEIQRVPELFRTLRVVCDRHGKNGWIILTGSSSPELLRQSSESMAGRIGFLELTPFSISEVSDLPGFSLMDHWLKGGFPRSYQLTAPQNFTWISNYLRTFFERDIYLTGKNLSQETLNRLVKMLVQSHGGLVNWSKIGESIGLNYHTVQSYCEVLEKTFLIRMVSPFNANIKKRLIKSPKLYFRDSGVFHYLLKTRSFNDLMASQYYGASWEGYAVENIINAFPEDEFHFYRTASGVEIDLVMLKGQKRIAIEFKASRAPQPGRGFYEAINDLEIDEAWVICPIEDQYLLKQQVHVSGILPFIKAHPTV